MSSIGVTTVEWELAKGELCICFYWQWEHLERESESRDFPVCREEVMQGLNGTVGMMWRVEGGLYIPASIEIVWKGLGGERGNGSKDFQVFRELSQGKGWKDLELCLII